MDTREKIISVARARQIAQDLRHQGIPFRVVSGSFDVLQPALVRDLDSHARHGARLFAFVIDPERPILPAAARRELAAALRVIDYVVQPAAEDRTGAPRELLAAMHPLEILHSERQHQASAERLIQHVFERHGRRREPGSGH